MSKKNTLLILRHAKAKSGPEYPKDIERPLSKKGKEDAAHVGQMLHDKELIPDVVICSPAKRTRQTARLVCEAMGCEGETEFQEDLYYGSIAEHLAILKDLDDEVQTVLLIGHNPVLEELINHLTDSSISLATAAVAEIALPGGSWSRIDEGGGELVQLFSPE